MGLFTTSSKQSKPDATQRMLLSKNKKSNKSSNNSHRHRAVGQQQLQLKGINSSSSSSTEDDDLVVAVASSNNSATKNNRNGKAQGPAAAAAADYSATASAAKKSKTKFWRLHEDVVAGNTGVEYIPPPGINPNKSCEPVDPFASSSRSNSSSISNGALKHNNNHLNNSNGGAKKKKQQSSSGRSFQRLDSMDDGSMQELAREVVAASKQRQHHHHTTPSFNNTKTTPTRSQRHMLRPPSNDKKGVSSSHKKVALPSVDEHQQQQQSTNGKEKRLQASTTKKKSGPRTQLELTSSGESFESYQPPPFSLDGSNNHRAIYQQEAKLFSLPTDQQQNQNANHGGFSGHKKSNTENQETGGGYQKGFLLDVIRHSSGSEDTFDVRSQSTIGGSSRSGIKRCDSGGLQSQRSGLYSEASQSGLYSESGFPSANGGHTFRQIIFDDDAIAKVAVAKSDAGASDFSDFVKAASHLTASLSTADMKQRRATAKAGNKTSPVPPPMTFPGPKLLNDNKSGIGSGYSSLDHRSSLENNNHGKAEPISAKKDPFLTGSIAPTSLPSRRNKLLAAAKPTASGYELTPNWNSVSNKAASEALSYHDDGAVSVASNQSSHKSRQDFQAAIRAKARTPLSEQKEPRRHRSHRSVTTNDGASLDCSNVSVANATFSNSSIQHEANPFAAAAASPFCTSNATDPFVVASDFSVAIFSADDDADPFHIGEAFIATEDSAWNVNANPFQDLSSQSSKHTPNRQVSHAVSMDDSLIASIRKASSRHEKRIDPDADLHKRDPSPRAVQPSSSDSVLEYSRHHPLGPQRNPPKAVPSNAILGSMLFRQTQSIHGSEGGDNKTKKTTSKRKESPRADDECGARDGKVPRSVLADDAAESIVSSVTEEASSFYQKNFGGSSAHWNKQAQNVLNHYNVKKTLQARDTNAHNKMQRLHARGDQNAAYNQTQQTPPLTRLEEEHANMFR